MNLEIILKVEEVEKFRVKGIIFKKGEIIHMQKTDLTTIPSSHGRYNLNDVYLQLKSAVKRKYKNKPYEIEIRIRE